MGRPGKYETPVLPRLDEITDWCRNGATNAEIAERLGIAMSSFCDYQNKHVEFSEVLKKTKDFVDGQVENALLQSALAGNTTAQIFWLKNRRPDKWRDKMEVKTETADKPVINFTFKDCAEEVENDERYRATCTNLINKVCLRLRYEDLPAEKADLNKWLADTKERLYLGDRDLKRVKKVVLKILNGKVRYEKLTADDILDMLGEANVHSDAITFQSAVIVRHQNFIKALTFLAGVVAMTVFRYYPTWTDFLFDIIINATLLVGATYSAILNSKSFLRRKTAVVENQNIFLSKRMGLTDEYNGKSGAQ